jgi:pimeloyl-ACP methyl ester carboxylesterase
MATANVTTLPKQFNDPLPAYTQALANKITCQTLLIEGEKSPRMYRHNVAMLHEWLLESQKHPIAGASHGMNVTHAAAFNRILLAFASEVAA